MNAQAIVGAVMLGSIGVLAFVNWDAAVIVLLVIIMIGIGNLNRKQEK